MKALDTNIIVRFLVSDDELQTQKVFEIFKNAELEKNHLFIPLLVVIEVIWVLESVYEISRNEIINAIKNLSLLPFIKIEKNDAIQNFLRNAELTNFDLSDLLIAYSAKNEKCENILTFDKKASRHEFFELVN